MKISINTMQKLSKIKNSVYDTIKIEYLYHSSKLEGSIFKEYKEALYKAQTTGDLEQLVYILEKCQKRLDEKLESYISTIKQVTKEVE